MQHAKLKILCLAMSVCAVATASAQTYGPAIGDTVDDGKAISDSKGSAGRDLPRSVPAMGDTTDIGPEVSAPNPNVNLGPIPQKIPGPGMGDTIDNGDRASASTPEPNPEASSQLIQNSR